jgi:hypothetical protein
MIAACGGPAPTIIDAAATPFPTGSAAPTAVTTFPPGAAAFQVVGVLFEPCTPPPSGCGYDVTLHGPGGVAATVGLAHERVGYGDTSATPLRPEPGLPPTLAPGDYTIVFQSLEYSDVASLVPLPSGGMGYLPEVIEGCRETFTVRAKQATVRVKVTWRYDACTVKVTRR